VACRRDATDDGLADVYQEPWARELTDGAVAGWQGAASAASQYSPVLSRGGRGRFESCALAEYEEYFTST
jgi:hypothetical protein